MVFCSCLTKLPRGMMESREPWESYGGFHAPSWPVSPGSERNIVCPIFIVAQGIFEAVVVDLHRQIIILLYYFLAHFTRRALQPLPSMGLL